MTTTPNLPSLPAQRVLRRVMPDDYRYGDVYGYTPGQMQAYALAAYQAGRDAGIDETIAACLTSLKELGVINRLELSERIRNIVVAAPSQSSYSNNSNRCLEALKWTAAGFRTLVKIYPIAKSDRFVLDDGTRMSVGEILDMADAALGAKS